MSFAKRQVSSAMMSLVDSSPMLVDLLPLVLLRFRLADDEQDYRRVMSSVVPRAVSKVSQRLGWSHPLCHAGVSPLLWQKGVVDLVLLRQRQNTT